MTGVRFSRLAIEDLALIGQYTLENWGPERADQYFSRLEACYSRLVQNPRMGRACDFILPGLRRLECGKHVIFYRRSTHGVQIVRILHERMLPSIVAMENED